MKTIKQLREENLLQSGEPVRTEIISEGALKDAIKAAKSGDDINNVPAILILKRRSIRVFPDGQKVAMYWSDAIGKYVTVPFSSFSFGINEGFFGALAKGAVKGAKGVISHGAETVGITRDAMSKSEKKSPFGSKIKVNKPALKKGQSPVAANNNAPPAPSSPVVPSALSPEAKKRQKIRKQLQKATQSADKELSKENYVFYALAKIIKENTPRAIEFKEDITEVKPSEAVKIMEVYDSLKTENKKRMLMLMEDSKESFDKILEFSKKKVR